MNGQLPKYGEVWIVDLGYQLEMEIGHMGTFDGLAAALGVPHLNQEDVQIVQVKTISDLGLPAFLTMGYGIAEDDLVPHATAFNALKGSIAVIRAGAFGGAPVTVKDETLARVVAVLHEAGAAKPALTPTPTDAAKGTLTPRTKAPKSDARIGGMVAMAALLVMFALVVLMIWIAG